MGGKWMESAQEKEKKEQAGAPDYINNIEIIKIAEEECIKRGMKAEIVAVIDGDMEYVHEAEGMTIGQGQLAFFPPGTEATLLARESSKMIIFQPTQYIQQLRVSLNTGEEENNRTFLDMKGQLFNYMQCLWACLAEGSWGEHFYTVKTEELSLLLKRYYKDMELSRFFGPFPITHTSFAHFVYTNYDKVKTVKELAWRSNLSLSGFEKEFRKVFHVAPYRWMKQKKTESIYYEICHGTKPLKVVSEEYGFSSTSQFNDYCKKEFGLPPGKIRRSYVNKDREE